MSSIRRISIGGLGIALSVACLWFVFHDIDFNRLLSSVDRIEIWSLLASIVVYWGGVILSRCLLVRQLLKPLGQLSLGKIYKYICIGFLANNVLPLRMGEGVRIVGIARTGEMGIAAVAGGLVLERLIDMTMIVMLGVIASQLAPLPDLIQSAALIVGLGVMVAYLVASLMMRFKWGDKGERAKGRVWAMVWRFMSRFISGFQTLGSSRGTFIAVGFGLSIWLFSVLTMVFRLMSFGLSGDPVVALVLLTCLGLGVALPSAPAYTGVYHAAAVLALHDIFNVEKEIAVGFAFFSWVVDVSIGSTAGAVSLFLEELGWSDLRIRSERRATKTAH